MAIVPAIKAMAPARSFVIWIPSFGVVYCARDRVFSSGVCLANR
jgi:hypothetical protein